MNTPRLATLPPLLLPIALAGCSLLGGDEGGDSTQDNIAQYEQLRLSLEQNREELFRSTAVDSLAAVGSHLTWLDITQGWEAQLHIRTYPSGNEIIADVTVGDEKTPPFYRISDNYAMTGLTLGTDALYSVIDLETGALADEISYKKPQYAKYDAYGLYGEDAYLVVEDEGKMIYEWTVGTGAPIALASMDELGINLGAWIDFAPVEYGGSRKIIALGTYGTFAIDLGTLAVNQIPLPITPLEIGFSDAGMAVADGFDLWFVAWGDSEARAIHDELKDSSYEFNSSFPNAHWMGSGTGNQDVSMDGDTIYYNSVAGIYAYGVDSGEITPILLDNANYDGNGLFIKYTGINLDGNGSMYILGLESSDGAGGSDGSIYRVTL